MGERLGRAGRLLGALFLSVLRFPFRLLKAVLRAVWRGLGLARLGLRRLLTAAGRGLWALLGRLGLALRHLITLLFWRPLLVPAGRRLATAGGLFRQFAGRATHAIGGLLARRVLRPLWLAGLPLRWCYRRILRRPLAFIWLSLRAGGGWLVVALLWPTLRAVPGLLWAALGRLGRAGQEQLWQARQRFGRARLAALNATYRLRGALNVLRHGPVFLDDRGRMLALPGATPAARAGRLASVVVAAGVLVALGTLSDQSQPPAEVVVSAETALERALRSVVVAKNEQPAPKATPQPSPTPRPAPTEKPEPAAEPRPAAGSLLFSQHADGYTDLFALTAGAAEPLRLTFDMAEERDPTWSPDGRSLAYAARQAGNWDIYVLRLPGGRVERLTDDPAFQAAPAWSPDGEWLAFEGYHEGNLDLYLMPAEGGPPTRLTEEPGPDSAPVWAPGGRHLIFTSWRAGEPDLFALSLDAPADAAAWNLTQSAGLFEDAAALAPDGRTLAYQESGSGLNLVYVLSLSDYLPVGSPRLIGQGRQPTWSPDGRSLAYVYDDGRRNYLVTSALNAWGVPPQAYAAEADLNGLAWSALALTRDLPARLAARAPAEAQPVYVELLDPPQPEGAPYLLRPVEVSAPSPYLSDRVNGAFNALRLRLQQEAGWDVLGRLDGLYLRPGEPAPLGEPEESWARAGRAFDLQAGLALALEPQLEVVREDWAGETYWRVFSRAAAQDGSQGEPLRRRPWNFQARYDQDPRYYDQGGRLKETIPAGYYVDLTALAADYGWERVPAHPTWRGFFPAINFWRFEKRQDLSWAAAMAELYPD